MSELLTDCLKQLSLKLALRNDHSGVTIVEEALRVLSSLELEVQREKSRADAHYENYVEMLKRVDLWVRRFDKLTALIAELGK